MTYLLSAIISCLLYFSPNRVIPPQPLFLCFIRAVCGIYYTFGILWFFIKIEYFSDKKLERNI